MRWRKSIEHLLFPLLWFPKIRTPTKPDSSILLEWGGFCFLAHCIMKDLIFLLVTLLFCFSYSFSAAKHKEGGKGNHTAQSPGIELELGRITQNQTLQNSSTQVILMKNRGRGHQSPPLPKRNPNKLTQSSSIKSNLQKYQIQEKKNKNWKRKHLNEINYEAGGEEEKAQRNDDGSRCNRHIPKPTNWRRWRGI